jgi:hypothetical protein
MRFTVIWTAAALDDLMAIWISFPGRRRDVTQAADEIERALRVDPQDKGRPYDGDRILIKSPLAVVYSINEDDRKVEVIEFRLI